MTIDGPRFSLTIPSDLRMLGVARSFVEAACEVHALDRAVTHAIVLATAEALSNVIRHAHKNQADAQVQIHCCFSGQRFQVEMLDEGDPFDVTQVPQLDPAELRVGGRGVFLMRALMDEVNCEARGPRGNVLRMVKHLTVRECG